MKKILVTVFRVSLEILLPGILVIFSCRAGMQRLEGWNGPAGSLSNDLFVPALMMNVGKGFSNVEPSEIPELRAFLDFRAQKFELGLLHEDVKIIPLHPFQEYHRYLIYSVACIWRCFGVSWDAMKILILIYFCLAVLCVYGICRLGLCACSSFLASFGFIFAQPVLWTLPILRDFAKAPFILALIFLLGISIRRRLTLSQYFLLTLAAGVLLGAGMGFRRDMMVFLPVSIFFLMLCRLYSRKWAFMTRLAAVGLLVTLYIACGWPVHKALYRDGYVAAHDTIMGFASFSDHEIGLIEPASYEKHYLLNDLFCTLRAHDLAKRGVTFPVEVYHRRCNEVEFDHAMKRAYITEMLTTFPGDFIARAYAAVLRIATAIVPAKHPLAQSIERHALKFLFAGLLLIAAQKPVRAWLILVMLCNFCGYTSIQFAFRHAFHMSFVPYFFFFLCIEQIVRAGLRLVPRNHQSPWINSPKIIWAFPRATARAALWAVVTLAILYAPLSLARTWQHTKVKALKESYEQTALITVPYRVLQWNDRDIFIPMAGRKCHLCQSMGLIVDIETRQMAASFKDVDVPLDIQMIYEWEGLSWDFSAPATFVIRPDNLPVGMKYYFPVHEVTTCSDWNHFVGISLPKEQSQFFQGFEQVEDTGTLGLLVNMAIPDKEELFIAHQRLALPWTGGNWTPYRIYTDFDPFLTESRIKGMMNQGDLKGALELTDNTLILRPESIQFVFLKSEILDKMGESEGALRECRALLEVYPDTFALYARLDRFFNERGGAERRKHEWSTVLEQNPSLTCARYYLENAQEEITAEPSVNTEEIAGQGTGNL